VSELARHDVMVKPTGFVVIEVCASPNFGMNKHKATLIATMTLESIQKK